MHKIMLVDDEANIIRALQRALADSSYEVYGFTDSARALQRAQAECFDLILSDYKMPGMDGVSLLKAVKAAQPETMRLILSGYADLQALINAINEAEIYRFIGKPWNEYELKAAIHQALAHRNLLLENRRLADTVRKQQDTLQHLETRYPGISHVDWGEDGSILLNPDG